MNAFQQMGVLAIGSRMKVLSDRLVQAVSEIYQHENLPFEPRWFPIFYLLSTDQPYTVMELAAALGVSHPAINQLVGEMSQKGYIAMQEDEKDRRRRLLTLSEEGKALLPRLRNVWNGIEQALSGWVQSVDAHFLENLEALEESLNHQDLSQRYLQEQAQQRQAQVNIIDYDDRYAEDFKTLNEAWIQQYFAMEPEDQRVLSNPKAEIIAKGGHILFARYQDHIVGTVALLKKGPGLFELAKMAVDPNFQGLKIGHQLIEVCIQKAKALKAKTLYLETNRKLLSANHLYSKFGFHEVPLDPNTPYTRTNKKMMLDLSATTSHQLQNSPVAR